MFPASSLAEISRNTSVISSSSSSSSSTSDSNDVRPVLRPARVFAAPRSASDSQSVRLLPSYIQRELGVEPPQETTTRTHFNSPQDFEFGDILGHGSYSTVIQAQGKKSGRTYAIKVLDKAHLQRHNQRRTAYAEKEALVVLGTTHPGIVGLHSTFSDAWSLYFVLDLLPNGDLRALISRYGSLSLACTRYYVAQLTDALAYIHTKGVMHRDIKPENLLLDARFRLALADFGTAKVLPASEDPVLRRSNTFVGTPQYYSPELLANSHTSTASDLWALGCVLFELHTGTFTFNGPSPLITWRLIKALSYTLPDGFDPDAADLIGHLLLIEPTERLGAGAKGSDMLALKNHAFFQNIDWEAIWKQPHPPLETGLKQPPEPVGPPPSDAELSAQLREERMQEEDDDEIAWAKDARIAAYLPGLRYANGNRTINGDAESQHVLPQGDYVFPRVEGRANEDGEVPYDAVQALDLRIPTETAPTAIREADAATERALDQPLNVDVVEHHVALNGNENVVPPAPVSTPLETTTTPPYLEAPVSIPPDVLPVPPREYAHLLQANETLLLCTPLQPEPSTPGTFVRLLPRLLSGSLRGKKPKLKERVLLLTNRRVLCVSTGKSVPILKAEFTLIKGGAGTAVRDVEVRGDDGVLLLTSEKGVLYMLDENDAQKKWIKSIRGILGDA